MNNSDKKRQRRTLPPALPRLPQALYTTGWSNIVENWHKSPNGAPKQPVDVVQMGMVLEGFRTAEALVISPAVCCHVYGENVVLCRLIDGFGIAGVEQLLEEGALKFLLWSSMVLYMPKQQKVQVDGVDPLLPGNASTVAHRDAQASVELGLKGGWTNHPWSKLERLAKLAIERTHVPVENVSHDAVAAVRLAYDNGALHQHGFDSNRPRHELDDQQRALLSRIAEDVAKGVVLYDLEYDFHESAASWDQLLRFGTVARAPSAAPTVNYGLKLEGVPNIPGLLASRAIEMKDIAQLRNHSATQELRKWLWAQPDPRDAAAVGRAWLAQMTTTPLKDRTWFKVARLSFFSVLGGVVGAVVGGPPGFVGGALAGSGLNQALGAFDSFGMDKWLTRPGPRRFAELARVKAAEKASAPASGNRKERRAAAAKQRGAKR